MSKSIQYKCKLSCKCKTSTCFDEIKCYSLIFWWRTRCNEFSINMCMFLCVQAVNGIMYNARSPRRRHFDPLADSSRTVFIFDFIAIAAVRRLLTTVQLFADLLATSIDGFVRTFTDTLFIVWNDKFVLFPFFLFFFYFGEKYLFVRIISTRNPLHQPVLRCTLCFWYLYCCAYVQLSQKHVNLIWQLNGNSLLHCSFIYFISFALFTKKKKINKKWEPIGNCFCVVQCKCNLLWVCLAHQEEEAKIKK